MGSLRHRIKKAEEAHTALTGGDAGPVFFWRDITGVPGEKERRFCEENPDFQGKIYTYCFGTKNLKPPAL